MKFIFIGFIFFASNAAIYACICPGRLLRTTFKDASAVFIGKLAENNLPAETKIRGAKNGVALEVEKSWKGAATAGNHFSVTPKFEDHGICTAFFKQFEKDKKYLIIAEGKNFEVRNYCTYSGEIYSASDHPDWYRESQQKVLRKLDKYDNFWFRFGKRVRLF
jgi:hypothetical protein